MGGGGVSNTGTGTQRDCRISILGDIQHLTEQDPEKPDLVPSDLNYTVILSLWPPQDRTHCTIASSGALQMWSFTPSPLQEAHEGSQSQAAAFWFFYHFFISISSKGVEVTWIGSHTTS